MIRPMSIQIKTIAIAVTGTASTSVALPSIGSVIRIVNSGSSTAYVSIGGASQTATVPTASAAITCIPVLPSSDNVFSIPDDSVYNISAICDTSLTTTLFVSVGEGV